MDTKPKVEVEILENRRDLLKRFTGVGAKVLTVAVLPIGQVQNCL